MEGAEAPSIRAFQNPPDGVREGDQLPPVVAAAQRLDSARQSFQYKADVAASAAAHLQGPMLIMHVLDHLPSLVRKFVPEEVVTAGGNSLDRDRNPTTRRGRSHRSARC